MTSTVAQIEVVCLAGERQTLGLCERSNVSSPGVCDATSKSKKNNPSASGYKHSDDATDAVAYYASGNSGGDAHD